MTVAYFDTNVFDHILNKKNGVTSEDEDRLRSAISDRRLIIVSSFLAIQETLAALRSGRPEIVLPQLKLITDLWNWAYHLKPHHILLEDDIRHFAWAGEPSNPFLSPHIVQTLRNRIERLIAGKDSPDSLVDSIEEDH